MPVEDHRHNQRSKTEADWLATDPTPGVKEVVWVTDLGEYVIGDGVTPFSGLDRHGASTVHTHAASEVDSGTLADAQVAESNVTQHEAALTVTEAQVSDLAHLTLGQVGEYLGESLLGGESINVNYDPGTDTTVISVVTSDFAAAGHQHSAQQNAIAGRDQTGHTVDLSYVDVYNRFTADDLVTVTVPAETTTTFADGAEVPLYAVGSAGLTVETAAGVTVNGSRSLAEGQRGTLKHITGDLWDMHAPTDSVEHGLVVVPGTVDTTGEVFSFHIPHGMDVDEVFASLDGPTTTGDVTVDIKEDGTSILSTNLTIDATEKASNTAATAAVISDRELAQYAEITFELVGVGDGTATGLVVWLKGQRAGIPAAAPPAGITASDILNNGTAFDGATGVETALDISIVPDETTDSVQRVDWYIDDVLFRDDDLDSPYELRYDGALLQLDTVYTAPSGNNFEIVTDGTSYEIRADVIYTSQTVTSTATFTTANTVEEPPSGGVGDYTQDPFTANLTEGMGTINFDPADYANIDLIFVRDPSHVGLAGVGVDRDVDLTTVGSGNVTITAASQPGSPTGSGTQGDPFVYTLARFEGSIELDGSAGEYWIEFDRCWGWGSGAFAVQNPSGPSVHAHAYDCDFESPDGSRTAGNATFMNVDDLVLDRCLILRGEDGFKLSDSSVIRDCYITVFHTDGAHTDVMQWADDRIGTCLVQRSWCQGQSWMDADDSGAQGFHYGNAVLMSKADDSGPIQYTIEDSFCQSGSAGLYRNGNSDPDSYFISRRNVWVPALDGSRSTWGVGSDPFKDQLSPRSSGPDRTTRSSSDDYHYNGTLF